MFNFTHCPFCQSKLTRPKHLSVETYDLCINNDWNNVCFSNFAFRSYSEYILISFFMGNNHVSYQEYTAPMPNGELSSLYIHDQCIGSQGISMFKDFPIIIPADFSSPNHLFQKLNLFLTFQ